MLFLYVRSSTHLPLSSVVQRVTLLQQLTVYGELVARRAQATLGVRLGRIISSLESIMMRSVRWLASSSNGK